ncbi:hypothetical protein [Spirosoma aerophilum]
MTARHSGKHKNTHQPSEIINKDEADRIDAARSLLQAEYQPNDMFADHNLKLFLFRISIAP